MKHLGLSVVFLVVGLLLGYFLRYPAIDAPQVGPPSPTRLAPADNDAPPVPTAPLTDEVLERLRARIAELEGILAEKRPIRLAEVTQDPKAAGFRVIVVDEEGQPRPGFRVDVMRHVPPVRRESGETDGEGRVEVFDFRPGPVNITVIGRDAFRAGIARLAEGRVTEILVRFPRGGVPVHGTVTDRRSGPVTGCLVFLNRIDGEFQVQHQTKTDDAGRYRFERVPPDTFSLSALVGTWPEDRRSARKVRVPREGELEQHLVLGIRSLFGVARVAGTREPIVTYTVHLGQRRDIRRGRPAEGGEYEFLDLSAGTYLAWVRAPGYVRKNHGNVEIVAGRETRIDFEMVPAAILILEVLDRQGRPVIDTVGFSVRVGGAPARSGRLPSGEGGILKIDELPPGKAEIAVGVEGVGRGQSATTLVIGENRHRVCLD